MKNALVFLCAWIAFLITPSPTLAQTSSRIWVDTDAACGVSAFKDVDDCLALAALVRADHSRIAGISTSFGNVARPVADGVVTNLTQLWSHQYGATPVIWQGARAAQDCRNNQAATALANALRRERLSILTLGPLTNLSCVLRAEPRLAASIDRVFAVAGARPGHVFHPAEGAKDAILFGHGPVVTDLNIAMDVQAMTQVLNSNISITLTPYEVARELEVRQADLSRFAQNGALELAIAEMAVPWLATWKKYIGRDGFYPFDLMAVAAILTPQAFTCQQENAQVRVDTLINSSRFGPQRLLIGGARGRPVTWCNHLSTNGKRTILNMLGGDGL